jgi:NtrC-family two-component system response regulator AlgB
MTRGNELTPNDLPNNIANFNPSAVPENMLISLAEVEKQHIQKVMLHTTSLEEAAKVLQIDPATLWRKRKKYQIE